jgi:hypothetical protein
VLASDDVAYISKRIALYDHDWRFYSVFLGEPHLIDDVLVYFDGTVLYICAFPLSDIWKEADRSVVSSILNRRPEFSNTQVVDLWGRFSPPEEVGVGGRLLPRVKFTDYDPEMFDVAIDLDEFEFAKERSARLARNAVLRKGLTARIVQRPVLLAQHMELMAHWRSTHDVSPVHACMAASVLYAIQQPQVYVVESFLGSKLVGFSVVSFPAADRAIYLQGFARNEPGSRVGDSMLAGMVTFAKDRGAKHLHLGYSPSDSLLSFKRKWGARVDGPPFREAFFCASHGLISLINRGRFLWRQRLIEGVGRSWSEVRILR